MYKYLLLFLCVSFTAYAQTQDVSLIKKKKFQLNPWENVNGYRVSFNSFKNIEVETAYILSSYPDANVGYERLFMRVRSISAGIEYVRIDQQNVYGVKISYEENFSVFSAQIGADYLFTDKSSQVRLLPKLGISAFSFVTFIL